MLEIDEKTARKNLIMGWALFGGFVLLFAGTIAVAFIYLWIVD